MDLYVNVFLLVLTTWFAFREYKNDRILWAMFWSMLVGWDLHTILTILL